MSIRKSNVISEDKRYSKIYETPVIPDGYRHVSYTNLETGFQIERIKDGSILQFVPVGALNGNGTLDGVTFNEKFGRRDFFKNDPDELGEEPVYGINELLWRELQSIRHYGGMYVTLPLSRMNLKPVSIPRRSPWTMIDYKMAIHLGSKFENNNGLSSHLIFGAEYDSMLEWLIEAGKVTIQDVIGDNQIDIDSNEILGLGTLGEWTVERPKNSSTKAVVRGGTIRIDGIKNSIAWRQATYRYIKSPYITARAVLYIPV